MNTDIASVAMRLATEHGEQILFESLKQQGISLQKLPTDPIELEELLTDLFMGAVASGIRLGLENGPDTMGSMLKFDTSTTPSKLTINQGGLSVSINLGRSALAHIVNELTEE